MAPPGAHRCAIKMAKSMKLAAVVATALCFSSFLSFAFAELDARSIEGQVYCDSCRVHYRTKLSEFIAGATVALECKESEDGKVVYSKEAETDKSGTYRIPTAGCHALLCEVRVVKSPKSECNEIVDGLSSARIDLTPTVDDESVRYANDLGFMRNETLPGCPEALKAMFVHG